MFNSLEVFLGWRRVVYVRDYGITDRLPMAALQYCTASKHNMHWAAGSSFFLFFFPGLVDS